MGSPRNEDRRVGLALPFAILGLAAGWIADGFLANPIVEVIHARSQETAAIIGGGVWLALGKLIERTLSGQHRPLFEQAQARPVQLAVAVVGSGAVAGASVGLLHAPSIGDVAAGFVNGALAATAFLPVCALVVAAAIRARRARHGSIVAGADRRAVWSILATALSITTLAAAIEAPASVITRSVSPLAGPAMAIAAGAAILLVTLTDLAAMARVVRLGRTQLERRGGDEALPSTVPSVDLGIGDDVRARMSTAATAYRHNATLVALVLGSFDDARRALRRALARGVAGLAVVATVCMAHRWSATPAALADYMSARCDATPIDCYQAGMLVAAAGVEPACAELPARHAAEDVSRSEALFDHGCRTGNICACQALARSASSAAAW